VVMHGSPKEGRQWHISGGLMTGEGRRGLASSIGTVELMSRGRRTRGATVARTER
jgi:hypothetical protein